MAIEKTFFSYSRDDSEFVLKLAKDLRAAGANIWLDQLDIVAGKRWDAEIETALQNSQGQLVILSPSSVESNNVMDEVSFALENGKVVIPIIYKECQIPFRLKRLQYIDFTGDYKTAFDRLLSALNLETPQNVQNTSGTEDENKLNEQKVSAEEKQRQESETEEILWSKSKSENTVSSYRHYLNETKLGKYMYEANKQITNIEKEAELKRRKESEKENERIAKAVEKEQRTSEKNKIAKEASILSKKSYLKWAIPLVVFVAVIAVIFIINSSNGSDEIVLKEKNAWMKVNSSDIIWVIRDYIKNNPKSRYKPDAEKKLAVLLNNAGINRAEDYVVCNNIQNRMPVGIAKEFDEGNVYAWANVRAPKKESVRFEWQDNSSASSRTKSYIVEKDTNGYRIWDQHRYTSKGKYEVRLYNSDDKIIGSQTFTIK